MRVSIDGQRADILASDAGLIAKQPAGQSVQLLPSFDPYLMGHSSRAHIVDAANHSKVSRTAGWISAVVLVDGRVAGTWTHAEVKDTLRITVDPFQRLTAKSITEMRRKAESLAETLGLSRAEVQVA